MVKIAIASDDRKKISNHFGKAKGFVVVLLDKDKETGREYRENAGRNSGECGSCDHHSMIRNVKDCGFVISHGMGQKIFIDLVDEGIVPIITDEETVEGALVAFRNKSISNRLERLH